MKKVIISTQDGYKVMALVLTPDIPNPKAVIQFHSGTVTKKEFYLKLANYLVDQKYIVVLFDYRGVGESKPKTLRGFEMSIADWGRDDANSVTEWIKTKYPNLSVHLLAHSMGGQIYGLMQNWKIFDKVILLTTSSGNFNKFSPQSYKWKVKLPAILLFPLLIKIYGYIPGKLGVGEDWPKGVAQEWIENSRVNGLIPAYLTKKTNKSYYQQIDKEITAWYFHDDHLSTHDTIKELALSYPNAKLTIKTIHPAEVDLDSIGHFGLFKRKAKTRLWPMLIEDIER
ncbi:MAG: putative alpha/beta hydrolase [Saprospiraceae bacterium]|jgi:predicted alpha/beta hydrolase|tara:strand:+ start:1436 stop:2287 length:852 start_codon:yes stop_codon:yes gene_type:complete